MANDINKEDPHYKGEYGSIYEVNRKFPTGGVVGDFVVIDGWAHYWNAGRGTWCVNAERDSYWDEFMTNISNRQKSIKEQLGKKADAEQVNNSLYDLEKKIGERVVVEGDVTNLPDEEDLTSVKESERDVLKLADRSYAPENFSGKGYKILRRNIQPISIAVTQIRVESIPSTDGILTFTVNGKEIIVSVSVSIDNSISQIAQKIAVALKENMTEYEVSVDASIITLTRKTSDSIASPSYSANNTGVLCTINNSTKKVFKNILTSTMLNQPNTIYEIRYDFDLQGQNINCNDSIKLYFTSGSLSNGKITFDKEINLYGSVKLYEGLKINVNLSTGNSWNKHIHYPIYISWFIKPNEDIRDNDGNIKFDILYYRFYHMFEDLSYNTNANVTLIVENDNYIISDNIVVPKGVTIDFQNSTLYFSEKVLNGEYVFNLGIDKDVFDSFKNNFDIPDKTKYKAKGFSNIKICLKNILITKEYNNLHLILSVESCRLEHITYSGKGYNNILFYQPKGDATYSYLDMFEMYHINLGSTWMTPLDKLTSVYINIGDAKSIEHISGGKWYIENSQRTTIRHAINCVFNIIDSTVGLYNIHNEFNDNIYINNGVVLIQDSYLMLKGNVDDRNDRSLITLDKKFNEENSVLSNSTSILTLVNTVIGSEGIHHQFKGNSRYYIQAINGAKPILNLINSYVVLKSLLIDIPNNITKCRSKYLCDKNVLYTAKVGVVNIFLVNNSGYNFNLNVGDTLTYAIVTKHYKRNTIYNIYKYTLTLPKNKHFAFGWYKENVDLCDFDIYLSFDNINYTKLIKFDNVVGTIGNNFCYIPFNDDYMLGNKVEDINISFSDFDNKFTNDMICNKYRYNGNDDIVTYICETETNFHHLTNECKKQDIIRYNSYVYKFNHNIGKFVSTDKTTGTSSERPKLTNLDEGFEYYDSTLKKKILWNGSIWANIDGTELS